MPSNNNRQHPHNKTLLLVEDEALIALHEKEVLEQHGFSVFSVYSGEKAIETVNSQKIDLVLMDIDLGDGKMDGTKAAERILAQHDIPVIFLTGHAEEEMVNRVKGIARFGYVIKNSGEFVLLEAIDMAFQLFKTQQQLKKSEFRTMEKLHSILNPEGDVGSLELADIIQKGDIQPLMDSFFKLTGIGIGILDMKGNVIISTGWRDICTKFHRVHPETRKNCIESDTIFSMDAEPGTYRMYKCKNNMWDMATPIIVNNRRLGNLFLGQFFFDDEEVDYDQFKEQAKKYGFDEDEYLAALDRVPRWSRETVTTVMDFYTKFTGILISISTSNLRLARSIAELKRVQEELEEKEHKFSNLIRYAGEAVFVARDGTFVFANHAAEMFLGKKEKELEGENIFPHIHPEDRGLVMERHRQRMEGLSPPASYDFRIITVSGDVRWVKLNAAAITWEGTPATLNFITDITEQKKIEDALRIVLEHLPIAVFAHDLDGNISIVNRTSSEYTGYSREELLSMKVSDFDKEIRTRDDRKNIWLHLADGADSRTLTVTHIRKDGSTYPAEVHLTGITINDEPVILAMAQDITQRRQAEQQKSYLMKEMNHRVKNNLAMVSSLISLKNSSLGPGLDLTDLKRQVEAIKVVHEKLYRTEDEDSINLRDYVEDLLKTVFSSLAGGHIVFDNRIADVSIPAKTAVPLGLIINELAVNAIKHAFPGETGASFTATMAEGEEGLYTLAVSNSGPPFPTSISLENPTTLGLRLVSALTKQIAGSLSLEREPVTTFTLRFPA